jgi:protein MpaA
MEHRVHHYGALIQRWREVARTAGLRLQRIAKIGLDPVFCLKTPALAEAGGIYVSAGIHGDEPASCEALITWAEMHARRLARWPLLLFPCLNPWGLRNNIRLDRDGLDLNRAFHLDHPVISGVKRATAPHQFEVSLMLHEDYDGQGFYLYEIERALPHWGEEVVAAVRPHLPIDPRARIDAYLSREGVIRRRFDRARFERVGFPEAIWLHQEHSRRALTVETPSEFALERRVRAHVAVLEECVRRVVAG